MSIEYGVKIECYGDLLAEIDRQDEIFRTCKLCGLLCESTQKRFAHKNSEKCRKRIAEQKGIEYVPKSKLPRYCEECKITIQMQNWERHLNSTKHLRNVSHHPMIFYCHVCGKDFSNKVRPKRSYNNHLKNKKHLKKKAALLIV